MWLLLALNLDLTATPPLITEFPEIVILRGIYLRDIAIREQCKVFLEIGTARGWQSMLWSNYLHDKRINDGAVYTCDIIGMDESCFQTPVTGTERLSRRQLWQKHTKPHNQIHFFLREAESLAANVNHPPDMVYIDGEHTKEAVLKDFYEVYPLCSEDTIFVFDDFDDRFPGVQAAVNDIAGSTKSKVNIITFEPYQYRIGIMRIGKPFRF